jgi:predicted acylesterase/phospholipase RssA
LYEGALGAMLERQRPRWFSAVAGSSAGGITAALIAAGLRPEEIARETDAALATLRVDSRWAGLARLRRGLGYIPTTSLEMWLRQVLRGHLGARLGRDDADLVTFVELFDATGIELDVVAVDIDARQPFVFNHRQTPHAEVVLAVLASAAIPFAFSPLRRGGDAMIVDGGVSSNFPRFVFDDRSFRAAAGLDELSVPIIAFILDEPVDPVRRPQRPQRRPALIRALLWVLLVPVRIVIGWLPRLLGKNTPSAPARFPKPRGRAARSVVDLVDGVLMFAVPPGIFLASTVAVTVVVGIGGWYVGWHPLVQTLSDVPGSVGESLEWILAVIILVLVSLIPIYVWVIVLATLSMAA